jgi:hypothetical protein
LTYYCGFMKAFNPQKWKKFGDFSRSRKSWINGSMVLGI